RFYLPSLLLLKKNADKKLQTVPSERFFRLLIYFKLSPCSSDISACLSDKITACHVLPDDTH
uniref:Uncharacterized protein n=1 Tax=Aegilops tauschii subsp. strangulata TaxID=200361 RepID=A0A453JLQ8_AEGTS